MPRRVTAAALARFCAILKVIVAETRAEERELERTHPNRRKLIESTIGTGFF